MRLLATLHFVAHEPAGVRMVAIVATMLLGTKAIVATSLELRLSLRQWIAFTLWPVMRPSIFVSPGSRPRAESSGAESDSGFAVRIEKASTTKTQRTQRNPLCPLCLCG